MEKEDKKVSKGLPAQAGLPTIAKVGLGCLVLLIVLAVVGGIFANLLFKKVLQKSIENKTGIQTNLSNLEQGKFSFTDPKTGAKLDIGNNQIPDSFPKDFPVYPGSKIVSSLSGNQGGNRNGFWLTLSTSDALDKVVSYYQTNLKANGWNAQSTVGSGVGTNWAVTKDKLSGFLTIDQPKGQNETSIIIFLGAS